MAERYDWDKIKKDYITGNLTYEELCKKHGVKRYNTLAERAADEEWRKEREKYREEKRQKELEEIARKKAKKAARDTVKVDKVCDKLLIRITDMTDKVFKAADIKDLTTALANVCKIKGIKSEDDRREQNAKIDMMLNSMERNLNSGSAAVEIRIKGAEEYAE